MKFLRAYNKLLFSVVEKRLQWCLRTMKQRNKKNANSLMNQHFFSLLTHFMPSEADNDDSENGNIISTIKGSYRHEIILMDSTIFPVF